MSEDPRNHRRLLNGGDDPEIAATKRAVYKIDIGHALENRAQPMRADAARAWRGASWISTESKKGIVNLPPLSYFNTISSGPPAVMYTVSGDHMEGGEKDSLRNARDTGEFAFNLCTEELDQRMNDSSTAAPRAINEFEVACLTKAPSRPVKAPRVAESPVHMECQMFHIMKMPLGDKSNSHMVMSKVLAVYIRHDLITPDGRFDTVKARPIGRLGYLDYNVVSDSFEMLRPNWPLGGAVPLWRRLIVALRHHQFLIILNRLESIPMKLRLALLSCFTLVSSVQAAELASAFPERPMRVIVPFAPGAAADMFGRMIGQKLNEALGQPVIVDNRPGGGAVIGTEVVAKAPPDGYTVLLTTPAFVINATGLRKLPYDTLRDFAPISLFASSSMIIVSNPSLQVRNMKELIAYARSQPGKLTFASAGNGTINQLGMELLNLQGVKMTHVPYKGGGPALTDVAGGRVHLMLSTITAAQSLIKAGRLRPIAVSAASRTALFPDVPTVAEVLPGFEAINWSGIVAPAGTPPAAVAKINGVLVRMLRDPDVKEKLAREAAEPVGSSPEQFANFVHTEIVKWTRVVKETGTTMD